MSDTHPKSTSRDAVGIALSVGVILALVSTTASAEETSDASQTRRYALIVANNDSVDTEVDSLEYADDDGARYYEMFDSLTDETRLLTTLDSDSQRVFPEIAEKTVPPSRRQLDRTVDKLAAQIKADRKAGRQSELYLVFTGHGDVDDSGQGYLSLMNSKLHRSDLYRDVIEPLNADYTHLIVDACHAYFMVHSRGAGDEKWRRPFRPDPRRAGRRLSGQGRNRGEPDAPDRRGHRLDGRQRRGPRVEPLPGRRLQPPAPQRSVRRRRRRRRRCNQLPRTRSLSGGRQR
ncbi:MAG: hypothetical protein ABEN55_05320, partial [Bradymonadaceae bacterium]